MDLVVEAIGPGPRGLPSISVAHYYQQNGDMMKDPDLTFEIEADGTWTPTSFQQDNIAMYQEVFYRDGTEWKPQPKLLRDLKTFAKQWSANLAEQGFLAAAEAPART